jgi:hypothetical protein
MNRFWNQFSMSNSVTSELISDNLSGFAFVLVQQPLKETLCSLSISPFLQEHINNLTILIHSTPQIVLPPMDLHEHLINEESIAIALVLSSQTLGVLRTELIAP